MFMMMDEKVESKIRLLTSTSLFALAYLMYPIAKPIAIVYLIVGLLELLPYKEIVE